MSEDISLPKNCSVNMLRNISFFGCFLHQSINLKSELNNKTNSCTISSFYPRLQKNVHRNVAGNPKDKIGNMWNYMIEEIEC